MKNMDIRKILAREGITQKELSVEMRICHQRVSSILSGDLTELNRERLLGAIDRIKARREKYEVVN